MKLSNMNIGQRLVAAMVAGAAVLPAPAAAQGLLGRIGKVVDKVEGIANEAEQRANQTGAQVTKGKRLIDRIGPRRGTMPAPAQMEPAPDPGQQLADFAAANPGSGDAAAPEAPPRLMLFTKYNLDGRFVELTTDTPSLHTPELKMGDLSYSLNATGRWELCHHTQYRGECVTYEGRHDQLLAHRGKFSSARYVGPASGN